MKVLLIQSEASPYRLPLFDSLAREVDLEVYYCNYRSERRKWEITLNNYKFKSKMLKCWTVGPFMLNPTLFFTLLSHRYDLYILGEDTRTVLSELTVFLVAKLFGKPLVVWSGQTRKNFYERYKELAHKYLFGRLNNMFCKNADALLAYGEQTKDCLLSKGVSPEKIFVGTQVLCSNLVMKYQPAMKETEFDVKLKGKKVIFCTSYFDQRKGIDYLIKAFKDLDRDDAILIIAGSGKEEKNLKQLAGDRDDIYFPGYIEAEKKAFYFTKADIFVFPTLSDAWGLVVNEAMMFGLPVITTSEAGCAQELIRNNGFVVEPENVFELKETLVKLLDNDDLRKEMAARSLEIIADYTIENAKERFVEAINHASSSGRGK